MMVVMTQRWYTGDLQKESFSAIWHGDTYQAFRDTYDSPAPAFEKCGACYIMQGWDPSDYKPHFDPEHWSYVQARLAGDTSAPKHFQGAPVRMFVRKGADAVPMERRRSKLARLEQRRVLLFGASAGGHEAFEILAAAGLGDRIVAVCDNDGAKHGTSFRHLPITGFVDVPRDAYDYVIIASPGGKVAITRQLEAAGLTNRSDFGTLAFVIDYLLPRNAA